MNTLHRFNAVLLCAVFCLLLSALPIRAAELRLSPILGFTAGSSVSIDLDYDAYGVGSSNPDNITVTVNGTAESGTPGDVTVSGPGTITPSSFNLPNGGQKDDIDITFPAENGSKSYTASIYVHTNSDPHTHTLVTSTPCTVKVCKVTNVNVESGATDDLDGSSVPANTDVCAAIKGSGDVQVVAVLDPALAGGDTPHPDLVSWSGGTEVAGEMLKRKFTKANWAKETLTANCGTSSYSQIIYIVGAQQSGYKPADGQSGTHFTDNSQGYTSTGVMARDGSGHWHNQCEIEFTIKPDALLSDGNSNIIDKNKVNWDVSRHKRAKYWQKNGGTWSISDDRSASWESDDGGDDEEDNNPWNGNGHLYGNDAPYIGEVGEAWVQKLNMREWTRVGFGSTSGRDGTICSDYYYWHSFVSIKKNGANWERDNTYDNEIPPGNTYWGNVPVTGITITTTTLPNGTVNTAYSQTLTSTGGTGTVTWSLDSGSLPPGLSLNSSGTISGTPTTAGTYTFMVEAEDSSTPPASDLQQLSITIEN